MVSLLQNERGLQASVGFNEQNKKWQAPISFFGGGGGGGGGRRKKHVGGEKGKEKKIVRVPDRVMNSCPSCCLIQ